MNDTVLNLAGQQMRASLRSLIDDGNLPNPDATYIYNLHMIWGAGDSFMAGHTKIKYGTLVKNVRQRESGGYEFNLVDDAEQKLYYSNYAWAFVLNVPENAKRYRAYRALVREKRDLEKKITAAMALVKTLEIPKNGQERGDE